MTVLAIDGSITLHRAKNRIITAGKEIYESHIAKGRSEIVAKQHAEEEITASAIMNVFFSIIPAKIEEFRATKVYMLWDEGRCQYRVDLNPEYKVGRTLKPKTFLDHIADEAYREARSRLHKCLPTIGVASILIPGVEADDIAFYLSHTMNEGIMISDDKDWFLNMNKGWMLCRPMQKNLKATTQYLTNWSEFDTLMKGKQKDVVTDPRLIYLYEKACVGDKDEIPRIATGAPAKRIAEFLVGLRTELSAKDQEILDKSLDDIKRNLALADTNWLIKDPNIVNMSDVMSDVHSKIEIDNHLNFMQFASETKSFSYASRWNNISKRLAY